MNDLITSSTQSTSLAPNLNSNHQSLFKLPFIFTILMIFTCLFAKNYLFGLSHSDGMHLYLMSNNMASQILVSSLVYFMIATIVFAAQRMHQITMTNLMIIVMSCIIYQLFSYIITLMQILLMNFLVTEYPIRQASTLIGLLSTALVILEPIILIVITTLVSQFGKAKRTIYHLSLGNTYTILAMLFAFIFLLPSVVIFLPVLHGILFGLILSVVDIDNVSNVIACLFGMLPSLLLIIVAVVNFLIVFFSVKNCFAGEIDTIPLKSLFKAVGWSYLYLLGFGICISAVYISIVMLLSFNMPHYDQRYALTTSLMLLNITIIVINLIGVIKLTRKAVRKYFS